jgi:hypothetical protein
MEIAWETTPSELRVIAGLLEKPSCRQVRVNWYHTRLIFRQREAETKPLPTTVELDGDKQGAIPTRQQSQEEGGG